MAPYGDRRADLRTAYNTANTIAAGRTQQTQPDEFREMITTLMNYLGCDQRDPNEETPDAAALAMINREA